MGIEDEHDLLKRDDASFSRTRLYLRPLVEQALSHCDLSNKGRQELRSRLLSQVPQAALRFLANRTKNRDTSFALYFTWYIHEAVENHLRPDANPN